MKENKLLLFFSICISFITLVISIFLTFIFNESKETIFITNILLNIFAGAIIVIPTSLIYYFIQRKRSLEELMNYCHQLGKAFKKVEYLEDKSIVTLEEYISFLEREGGKKIKGKKEKEKIYNGYKEYEEIKHKKDFEKIIKQYVEISKIDLFDFWKIYGELHFINDYKNKVKYRLYNEIFDYTRKLKQEIDYHSKQHFEYYLLNEDANYDVMYDFLRELQTKVYYYEEHSIDDNTDFKRDFSNTHFIAPGVNCITRKKYFYVNEVADHYVRSYLEVGKIAYFNKNFGEEQKKEKEE